MKTLSVRPKQKWVELTDETYVLEVPKAGCFLRVKHWEKGGFSVTWAPGVHLAKNERGQTVLV
jgi:hypothetical protein